MAERVEQPLDAAAVPLLEDVVERFEPLAGFDGFELGGVFGARFFMIFVSRVDGSLRNPVGLQSFYCRAENGQCKHA